MPGRISADGLTWRPDRPGRLALAARYTVDAVALDAHGRRSARHTTFTTHVPDERFIGYVTPENRSTVGTGMIVSLEFNREIDNRAAVERAIDVTARARLWRSGRTGSATAALDFRPEHYWKPGTQVTVGLRLRDVEGAPGVYGLQHKTFSFTVGRHQTSLVDAAAHTMRVRRDGELARHGADHGRGAEDTDVQREDGGHRDARGDPDERRHGRLQKGRRQGRVRHPGRPARDAADHAPAPSCTATTGRGTSSATPMSATAAWACAM